MVAKKLGRSADIINTTYTGGNLTWVGDTVVGTAGENITVGNVVFLQRSTNTWLKAKADYTGTLEGRLGIATETFVTGATGSILTNGIIRYDTLAMTANVEYFVSEATAGAITASVPVATPALIRSVGFAQSAGVLVFNPENNYHYEYLAVQKNFGDVGTNYVVEQDNNGVERKFFKDDFSNDTIANYTISTGSPTISGGVLNTARVDKLYKTLDSTATTGKWEFVLKFGTAWATTDQYARCMIGSTSWANVIRYTGNVVKVNMWINSQSFGVGTFSTIVADDTYINVTITFDGTNYKEYIDGVLAGTQSLTTTVVSPSIGFINGTDNPTPCVVTLNEWTYTPSVAFTDSFTADTEARYMQQSYIAAWGASAAGDVVITTGTPGYITLAGSTGTEAQVSTILRSYNFVSGSYKAAFIDNGDGGGTYDYSYLDFCVQDINNKYNVCIYDQVGVGQTLQINKVVNGSSSTIASTALVGYTKGNKTWIEVHYSRETGTMWAYVWDNASVKPTAPSITGYDATFSYGKFGVRSRVGSAGVGNLSTRWSDFEIRANLIIGETNVPLTETNGYYLNDNFSTDTSGRFKTIGVRGVTAASGYLTGNAGAGGMALPSQVTDFTGIFKINASSGKYVIISFASDGSTYASAGILGGGYNLLCTGGGSIALRRWSSTGYVSITSAATGITAATDTWLKLVYAPSTRTFSLYRSPDGVTWTVDANMNALTLTDTTPTETKGSTVGVSFETVSDSVKLITLTGTITWMKYMFRGAQIGEYWDGTKSVICTRFTDDFNWPTSAEYGGNPGAFTWDNVNGCLYATTSIEAIGTTGAKFNDGIIEGVVSFVAGTGSAIYPCFRSDVIPTTNFSSTGNRYFVQLSQGAGIVRIYKIVAGVSSTINTVNYTFTAGVLYKFRVTYIGSVINVYIAPIGTEFTTTPTVTVTDTTFTNGYTGIGSYFAGGGSWKLFSLNINGTESTSTNGIAISEGGVPHGALFGTAHAAYIYGTPVQMGLSGKYIGGANCKTTYGSATKYIRHNLLNITDAKTLALDSNDYATGTTVTPTTTYSIAKRQPFGIPTIMDAADTLYLKVILDTTAVAIDTQPVTFINGFSFRRDGEDASFGTMDCGVI